MTHVHEAKIKEIVSQVLGVNAEEIQNHKDFIEAYRRRLDVGNRNPRRHRRCIPGAGR